VTHILYLIFICTVSSFAFIIILLSLRIQLFLLARERAPFCAYQHSYSTRKQAKIASDLKGPRSQDSQIRDDEDIWENETPLRHALFQCDCPQTRLLGRLAGASTERAASAAEVSALGVNGLSYRVDMREDR
jgi:hypothetical protein